MTELQTRVDSTSTEKTSITHTFPSHTREGVRRPAQPTAIDITEPRPSVDITSAKTNAMQLMAPLRKQELSAVIANLARIAKMSTRLGLESLLADTVVLAANEMLKEGVVQHKHGLGATDGVLFVFAVAVVCSGRLNDVPLSPQTLVKPLTARNDELVSVSDVITKIVSGVIEENTVTDNPQSTQSASTYLKHVKKHGQSLPVRLEAGTILSLPSGSVGLS